MGRDYHRIIYEFMELTPKERLQLNDLASKTNGRVASSTDHIKLNPYARCSVQLSRCHKGGLKTWLNFIKQSNELSDTNG